MATLNPPQPLWSTIVSCCLLFLLSCKPQVDLQPASPSTELIARIQEWRVVPVPTQTPSNLDSTRWLKLADGYHPILVSWKSHYAYDTLGRLSRQMITSQFNGPYIAGGQFIRSFAYKANEILMTSLVTNLNGKTNQADSQVIPLNEQGLARITPRFDCSTCGLDYANGTEIGLGMSLLFRESIYPINAGDSLRTYTTDGYLTRAQKRFDGEQYSLSQTINQGNITSSQILNQSGKPDPMVSQRFYTYDRAQAGLRNPHQFLGKASTNLLQQVSHQFPSVITARLNKEYAYTYDQKNRVKRYIVRQGEVNGQIRWMTVGEIEYINL